MELWVLADSKNGYTYDFEVYTGKSTKNSKFGLAYDVVMRLCGSIFNQGYHLFFDNFYTGVQLPIDLLVKKCIVVVQYCVTGKMYLRILEIPKNSVKALEDI